ncbi:MAG: mutY [Panacagrimonas sp.]|jgi:A/G-specific adenine glycosylase|nr:A/G-specific adenine glycosylase [Panacagrimonas sp.]MCC2657079.1 mutY [Panacagrimonas sp.]
MSEAIEGEAFAPRLLRWFDRHGRHDLPWQHPREAYRVWISEVMLQQTQVATVIPYFERFMARFADVRSLAQAPIDEVLRHWAGLGYYARARNLHRAAQAIVERHGGTFPADLDAVQALPGVGRSTAGAILAQAHGQRHAILDGNVRRVLARHAGIEGWPGLPRVQSRLWDVARSHLPHARLADYTQALMDLGNAVCRARAPLCEVCPVRSDCVARRQARVNQIPSARPARERPQRRSRVLLVVDPRGEVLLQRRAPSGIWGGLWCPPLVAEDEDLDAACRNAGADSRSARPLAPLRHAFTHFDLVLEPLRVHQGRPEAITDRDPASHAWIKLSSPDSWPGLPAPIRKLLLEGIDPPQTDLPLPPCPAPSIASSSAAKPKGSTARPTRARSDNASSKASPRKPGKAGSSTRRG